MTTSKTLLAKGQIKYEIEAKLVQLGGQIEMRLTGQIHANKQAETYYRIGSRFLLHRFRIGTDFEIVISGPEVARKKS